MLTQEKKLKKQLIEAEKKLHRALNALPRHFKDAILNIDDSINYYALEELGKAGENIQEVDYWAGVRDSVLYSLNNL